MKSFGTVLIFLINLALTLADVYRVRVNQGSYLNIRNGPGTQYSIVGSLYNNQYIYTNSAQSNGWVKFYKGYVSVSYLNRVYSGSSYVTNVDLNFRSGPSTGYSKITLLNKGTIVNYFDRDPWNNGWAVTDRGYCSMRYGNEDYLVPYYKPQTTTTTKPTPQPTPINNRPPITGPEPNHLTKSGGVFMYGDQKETYYNLNMNGVISIMRNNGFKESDGWTYGVRSDGVKTFGGYVMIAANLNVHPRGSFVKTSLGMAIVCDTGGFANSNPKQVDIAVTW